MLVGLTPSNKREKAGTQITSTNVENRNSHSHYLFNLDIIVQVPLGGDNID